MQPTGPKARQQDLIVREMKNELLVYDTARDRATALNPISARIWRECDGRSDAALIAARLAAAGESVDEAAVAYAFQVLEEAGLFSDGPPISVDAATRRNFLKRAGATAAIAIPIAAVLTVPTPAQAASCKPQGGTCIQSSDCCSFFCQNGQCQ